MKISTFPESQWTSFAMKDRMVKVYLLRLKEYDMRCGWLKWFIMKRIAMFDCEMCIEKSKHDAIYSVLSIKVL